MKKQKSVKLALISLLSNPDVEVLSYSAEIDTNGGLYSDGAWPDYIYRKYMGKVKYTIDIYDQRLIDNPNEH